MVDTPDVFIQMRVQHKKYMAIIKIGGVLLDIILENFQDIYDPYVTTDRNGGKATSFTLPEYHIRINDGKSSVLT